MSLKLLHEPETEDPILSVVNLIDIFLVIIAALLITVAKNPLINPFNKQDVTVITDAGELIPVPRAIGMLLFQPIIQEVKPS